MEPTAAPAPITDITPPAKPTPAPAPDTLAQPPAEEPVDNDVASNATHANPPQPTAQPTKEVQTSTPRSAGQRLPQVAITLAIVLFIVLSGLAYYAFTKSN